MKLRKLFPLAVALLTICLTVFGQTTQPIVKANPADSGAMATAKLPLFAAGGAGRDDGAQTLNGDCGVISFLKGCAVEDPESLKHIITLLPNGDFQVHISRGFGTENWEITPDYSTRWQAAPQNGNWMVALEKTVAIYYNSGSFAGIGGLAPFQVGHNVFGFSDYGIGGADMPKDDAALVAYLQGEIAKHRTMVVGTGGAVLIPPLVANHFYYVMAVKQVNGEWVVVLGSPWGSPWDVSITAANFLRQFQEISSQKLELTGEPSLPPPPATLPPPVLNFIVTTGADSSLAPRVGVIYRVPRGQPVSLVWTSSGGATAKLRQNPLPEEEVPLNSSITFTPAAFTTYTLTVVGPDKKSTSSSVLLGFK